MSKARAQVADHIRGQLQARGPARQLSHEERDQQESRPDLPDFLNLIVEKQFGVYLLNITETFYEQIVHF